jgi:hypothetical protein
MQLPNKLWLSRKTVIAAVGNWRRLKALEASNELRRHYPAGLKQARYRRDEVARLVT